MKADFFQEAFLNKPYRVHGLLYIFFIIAGFVYDSPAQVFLGLIEISTGADILVTDYIFTGGLGAAMVNAGLSGLLAVGALALAKHKPIGLTMGTLGLVVGIGFFGKNLINMPPIILGGFLYAKYAKMPYGVSVLRAVLATCLAPAVTQFAFIIDIPVTISTTIGVFVGIGIGFLINPLAVHKFDAHKGYNLYNVGFAAGFIGMLIFALYSLIGYDFYTLSYWSSGYNLQLSILLVAYSLYFIVCGALCKTEKTLSFKDYFKFHEFELDFFEDYKEKSYIHMGIMGFACFIFMLIIRGQYSGPVIGTILSVVGFGAFGKAIFSALPVMLGAMLAAAVSWHFRGTPINEGSMLVAILFSTCLSPLARKFGWRWGMLAGFIHLTFAANIGGFHGGMNLYNNGFAGGLTAMMLFPIITFFRHET
ncbi:MAG: DUF1576 domain-containing protein [Defluviitaleaceae bacterium]|nr:DUF1576 domain-containing protein [Defluviitaleaceae bacterium]